MALDTDLSGLLECMRVDEELDEPNLDDSVDLGPAHTACLDLSSEDEDDPEEDTTSTGAFSLRNRTKRYRAHHDAQPDSLRESVRAVLIYMHMLKLDLPLLLWALSYNLPKLVADSLAKTERTALLSSDELPSLLRIWGRPPRRHSKGVQSKGAAAALDAFSMERVIAISQREMVDVGGYMRTQPSDLLVESLLSIKMSDMRRDVQARAPTLWTVLRECSWSSRQEKKNIQKNPDTVGFSRHKWAHDNLLPIMHRPCS